MDRAKLEQRRKELTDELERIKAALFQKQGQIAMLNEMLALPDPDDAPVPTGETAPEG
jgi:hypothetical protein